MAWDETRLIDQFDKKKKPLTAWSNVAYCIALHDSRGSRTPDEQKQKQTSTLKHRPRQNPPSRSLTSSTVERDDPLVVNFRNHQLNYSELCEH